MLEPKDTICLQLFMHLLSTLDKSNEDIEEAVQEDPKAMEDILKANKSLTAVVDEEFIGKFFKDLDEGSEEVEGFIERIKTTLTTKLLELKG